MDLNKPAVVRALGAAAAVLLLIGIIGAATVDDETTVAADRSSSQRTTTTTLLGVGPSEDTTTTVAGTPSTTVTAATTRPGEAGPATTREGEAAVPDPAPAQPPAPGRYVYTVKAKQRSDDEETTRDAVITVEAKPDANGATRRDHTLTEQGVTATDEQAWSSASIVSLRTRFTGLFQFDCDWNPDVLNAPLPIKQGAAWTTNSTCTGEATIQGPAGPQKMQMTMKRVEQHRVTGKMMTTIGDKTASTWVDEFSMTFEIQSAAFNAVQKSNGTRRFDPPHGLIVYEKSTTETSGFGSPTTVTSERTLKRLEPS